MKTVMTLTMALALAGAGCGSSSGESQAVAIEFSAQVGGEEFVCGTTYDGLGADDSSLELTDFRFYVQDVELKNADGEYVPVGETKPKTAYKYPSIHDQRHEIW